MKRYLLLDNDGVLVDTEFWYFKATQRALAELGVTLEQDSYLQRMVHGASSWELAEAAGIDSRLIKEKQQQRNAYYSAYLTAQAIEIAGVEAALQALSASHSMAIVTTSTRPHFELIHNNRNIVPYMAFVLTREDYASSKPDPEPYLLAMERFGARPEECLVVEDSQRGLQAALAAGIDCAVVHNTFTAKHDFTGAKHFLNSLAELPELLHGQRD
ncbi:Phosphorylated carbohydrates phosphatase [Halioglobus japonicus]|nr:Phosphorylated carbohydrates phosphatase [Halioglobus japonicus]